MSDPQPPSDPPHEPWHGIEATPTTVAGTAMGVRTHTGTARMPSDREQKAAEHVRLLGIFTWVYAGFECLGVLFGLFYVGIGAFFVVNPPGSGGGANAQPPPDWFGWVFVGAGGFIVLLSSTVVILSMLSARDLMRHRRRTFCIVVAAIHCINIPLGAVLGIFTIIILCKPEAKALFERNAR